jgi:hypothetical protein
LALLVAGCATIGGVNKQYERIEYSDGVNKKEAVAIALKHLISTEHKNNYLLSGRKIKKEEDTWGVAFLFDPKSSFNKTYFQTYYRVYIDIASGQVIDYGIYKGVGFGYGFRPFDKSFPKIVE